MNDEYIARRFADARAINRAAGRPVVRYDMYFDAIVSWSWVPASLDDQLDDAQLTVDNPDHPDYMLVEGLANGDLTDWDNSH
jgi:hypothetical protein